MRWHILRTLLLKEWLRHMANRGGIVLVVLLLAAAMLLSFFGKSSAPAGAFVIGGVRCCYVDYWQDGPWIEHLRRSVPAELKTSIVFRRAAQAPTVDGQLVYPRGTGAIQIRSTASLDAPCYKVWVWYPGGDGTSLAPYEAWFWRESFIYLEKQAAQALAALDPSERPAYLVARLQEQRSQLEGTADPRSSMATALVLFGLFFVCVYLLPSLTCEERERGVLLAQALSPASPTEILAARFLFYPVLGMGLAALLAGIYEPAALARPFFWLALAVMTFGSMGIGLTISSLARNQRTASMTALCYMLVVASLLVICQQNEIPGLPWLALEHHGPRMLQAALAATVQGMHWWNLGAATLLAACWVVVATVLFRRYGWQ
jgi:hypothetical protein